MNPPVSENYVNRFGALARLYGQDALAALNNAHFAVVGLGGVGSWAAEALARSGIGEITLIDLDDVCVTNTNRQLHALAPAVGRPKVQEMAERLLAINPEIKVHAINDFLTKNNMRELVNGRFNVIIDAIDSTHIKAALVAYCSAIKLRLITVGSSGGKRNPQCITVSDLGQTSCDPMLAKIRTQLYRHYGFARDSNRKFRVDAVYSTEQMVYPKPDGSVCQEKQVMESGTRLDCAGGFGSAVMVTGTFGFIAATRAIERYLNSVVTQE